jgi:hypothetical protein
MAMAGSNRLSALTNSLRNDTIHSLPPRLGHFPKTSICQLRNVQKRISPRTKMTSSVSKDLTDYEVGEYLPEDYADWQLCKDPKNRGRVGILLHPTSLSTSNGIGELGQEALCFLDWFQSIGCTVWQVLPLVPPRRKSCVNFISHQYR